MPRAIRMKGPLNLDALGIALSALEARHETLRTIFKTIEGVNVQQVIPFQPRELNVINVPSEEALALSLSRNHICNFQLDQQPGWRVSVYHLGDGLHVLSIVMHHIISDGWSADLVRRELALHYSAALHGEDPLLRADELPIQYSDYAAWQRVQDHQQQLDYWAKQLDGSRLATFFHDKPRPEALTGRAQVLEYRIEGALYDLLQSFCKSRNMTPFAVLFAVFRAAHFRLTGVDDAAIGTVNANRDRWELRDVVGLFVNLQCIRTQVEGHSFEELLAQVQDAMVASFTNKDVPFERIVSRLQPHRDLSRHPLVQTCIGFHPQSSRGVYKLEGLETEMMDIQAVTRFDVEFHFHQEHGYLRGQLIYSSELYEPERMENVLSIFERVLHQGLAEPNVAVESMSLFQQSTYDLLNSRDLIQIQTTAYPRESSIVDVFHQQVAAYPNRLAVRDSTTQLTYAELDHESNTLSLWLAARSFPPETLIGVIANRSCHAVVALSRESPGGQR